MNAPHTPERLLRLNEVKRIVGLSRTTIYRHAALPSGHPEQFPRWIKLGRASAWSEREVAAWIERHKAARPSD